MRNNIKYCVLVILISVVFNSCKKDWFDVKSEKKLAVPSTLEDFQALLDNTNVMNFNDVSLGEAASDGHYVTDLTYNGFNQKSKNSYTWSQQQPYREVVEWGFVGVGAYTRIYYCNLILDGLKKIKDQNVIFKNVLGQVLFQRARTFYQLSQVFAPPHLPGRTDNELGIPLRSEADINLPSKRSTLKETYDHIIDDLLLAKDLLPDLPEFKSRGSKSSAYALLARVYLSIEDYANAGKYADLSLKIYSTLINYNQLDLSATQPITIFNSECIFQAGMTTSSAQSIAQNRMLIEVSFFNNYSEEDRRKYIFFRHNTSTNTVSYKGSYSGNALPFSGLATDELYLIRAECNARAGKITEAMKDLNTLLMNRYKPGFVSQVAVSQDDALRQILEERKKELLMRGLRWSDLRRLNRDDRFRVSLTRVVNGKTYTLEPNSYKYTFPIPEDIIQTSGILQNQGW
jgi:tetratricopeptide (TPR) repeat protein